mgnify:CR=1 FL=1
MREQRDKINRVGLILWALALLILLSIGSAVVMDSMTGLPDADSPSTPTPATETSTVSVPTPPKTNTNVSSQVETPPAPPSAPTDSSLSEAESYAQTEWDLPITIDFDASVPSFDIDLSLPSIGLALTNIGAQDADQHVELTSDRIDSRTERNAGTGFCIIGLAGENPSGVSYDVNADTNSVNATIDPTPDTQVGADRPYDAQSLVDACAEYPGKDE